jgi:hypothetical protein
MQQENIGVREWRRDRFCLFSENAFSVNQNAKHTEEEKLVMIVCDGS